jgi:hypothetical protein
LINGEWKDVIPLKLPKTPGHEKPEDIGISGALSAYSNEVLAAVFNLDPTLFDKLPKLEEDVFVVTGAA